MKNQLVVDEIVKKISKEFRCFGGDSGSGWGNPISHALKGHPAQFAAGVDVEDVVKYVLDYYDNMYEVPDPNATEQDVEFW